VDAEVDTAGDDDAGGLGLVVVVWAGAGVGDGLALVQATNKSENNEINTSRVKSNFFIIFLLMQYLFLLSLIYN
jgi:hypothetical protein